MMMNLIGSRRQDFYPSQFSIDREDEPGVQVVGLGLKSPWGSVLWISFCVSPFGMLLEFHLSLLVRFSCL